MCEFADRGAQRRRERWLVGGRSVCLSPSDSLQVVHQGSHVWTECVCEYGKPTQQWEARVAIGSSRGGNGKLTWQLEAHVATARPTRANTGQKRPHGSAVVVESAKVHHNHPDLFVFPLVNARFPTLEDCSNSSCQVGQQVGTPGPLQLLHGSAVNKKGISPKTSLVVKLVFGKAPNGLG
jgi:hypothetical protein